MKVATELGCKSDIRLYAQNLLENIYSNFPMTIDLKSELCHEIYMRLSMHACNMVCNQNCILLSWDNHDTKYAIFCIMSKLIHSFAVVVLKLRSLMLGFNTSECSITKLGVVWHLFFFQLQWFDLWCYITNLIVNLIELYRLFVRNIFWVFPKLCILLLLCYSIPF